MLPHHRFREIGILPADFPAAEISTEDLRLLEFSRALYAASNLEIDAIIDPVDSRKTNAQVLESA